MRFKDWGERSPTPSPRLRGEGWGEGKELNFFGRAFDQALLDLTQRQEIRSLFGDWGERSPTPSPHASGERALGEGKELNF